MNLNAIIVSSYLLTRISGFHFTTFLTPRNCQSLPATCVDNTQYTHRKRPLISLRAKEDEDLDDGLDEEPLAKGIDSVSWLPSVMGQKSEAVTGVREVRIPSNHTLI